MTVNGYLNLIPAENRQKQNFIAMVTIGLQIFVQIQDILKLISTTAFDVDVAQGAQLDVIGQWAGVSRNVSVPISNVYFSWDADYTLGWDYGSWQPSLAPSSITVLPDDAYRTLIKAKIAANKWEGTTNSAYAIWETIFPNLTILVQDHQNMSYDLVVVGGIIDSLTLALITGGYILLKPEGVRVKEYFVPIDDGPLFGWDLDNDYIKGWDEGSWARELFPT